MKIFSPSSNFRDTMFAVALVELWHATAARFLGIPDHTSGLLGTIGKCQLFSHMTMPLAPIIEHSFPDCLNGMVSTKDSPWLLYFKDQTMSLVSKHIIKGRLESPLNWVYDIGTPEGGLSIETIECQQWAFRNLPGRFGEAEIVGRLKGVGVEGLLRRD
ncbi:hypothetical protein VTL71DRAFT_12250 [Oculimacula yallundae]|uniref:Uncharacterized protein n=1 Tax=Oculimacula yallundae TaxID=86028 RepID=A0ABR4CSZ2_9HELO